MYLKNKTITNFALQIAVIESERGWGSKIDDWMVCLSVEDAKDFVKEFNSKNTESSAPDWYMYAEKEAKLIEVTDKQYKKLKREKRVWLSEPKTIS